MKNVFLASLGLLTAGVAAQAAPCAPATLPTYQNSGAYYACQETSGVEIRFNDNLLPNYAGLNLLGSNNSSVAPSSITVTPGSSSLTFTSSGFTQNAALLSAQAELVQFSAFSAGTTFTSTTFSLINPSTSVGGFPGLGTGLVLGQELVCIGGSFTSLPVGLATGVLNGALGTGYLGCTGTTLVGTAGVSSGPLSTITGALGLPSLTGLTDSAQISLTGYNTNYIDVIKILALVTTTGGTASASGFGDSFATVAPEPAPAGLLLSGLVLVMMAARRGTKE